MECRYIQNIPTCLLLCFLKSTDSAISGYMLVTYISAGQHVLDQKCVGILSGLVHINLDSGLDYGLILGANFLN